MITASNLRQDIYQLLDRVLSTGEPLEVKRKGRTLRIVPDMQPDSRLERLKRHNSLAVDPEELVHMDWSAEWTPDRNL